MRAGIAASGRTDFETGRGAWQRCAEICLGEHPYHAV
jgi:hypothetical protein